MGILQFVRICIKLQSLIFPYKVIFLSEDRRKSKHKPRKVKVVLVSKNLGVVVTIRNATCTGFTPPSVVRLRLRPANISSCSGSNSAPTLHACSLEACWPCRALCRTPHANLSSKNILATNTTSLSFATLA